VASARALAPAPALLIADEPTGNLDGETGRQIADLLFAKQAERNMTLLLVTHDVGLAARCGRQVSVRSGEIVDDGRAGEEGVATIAREAYA
jgi:putative ABC transport system ATP-binding protein